LNQGDFYPTCKQHGNELSVFLIKSVALHGIGEICVADISLPFQKDHVMNCEISLYLFANRTPMI